MITGVLAGALYLAFLLIGAVPFAVLAAVMAVIAFSELAVMNKQRSPFSPETITAACFVAVLVLRSVFPSETPFDTFFMQWLIIFALLLTGLTVVSRNRFHFEQAAYLLLSALYISFPFYLLAQMRLDSLALVLFVQITIWATDSGAYFVGRKLGRHKLAPHISPNKTIEGSLGAIVIAFVAAVLFEWIVPQPLFSSWARLIAATLIISCVGQIGDLVESAIKRHFGVKDSGNILPGHGGIFDRFDSLIFVLPVLFVAGVI